MMGMGEKAWFTTMLAALAGLMLYLSLGLSPVARIVPLTVLIPTLILILVQLIADLRPRTVPGQPRGRRLDFFQSERFRRKIQLQPCGAASNPDVPASSSRREFRTFGWLLAVPLGIYLVGFAVSLPLFILLYLKKRSGEGWLFSITTSLVTAGVLYSVFYLILEGSPYNGLLWTWLGWIVW